MDLNKNNKDDFEEVADGVVSFIQKEGVLLTEVAGEAWTWLQKELAGIIPEVQTVVQGALKEATGNGDRPLGEVIADTLTILYNEGHNLFVGAEQHVIDGAKAVKSEVVTQLAGLTSVIPK